jgi:ABC-type polysaccharide/polyol phosphate transport system ATPase subunit
MSSEIAITVENLSKCYQIYSQPRDRLKQFLLPRMQKLIGGPTIQFYQEFWALKDISFEVRKGESVGILGRNGSGKSTLLQAITGTLTPTSGSVITNGRISALLELGAGFNSEFSGRENVFLNLSLHGFNEEQIFRKFEEISEFADIGDFINQPVKTYSSGMYARLAFASAIHTDPEVLIVDEILAVGDAPFQQKCINRLYKMLDDGVSVLLVSHDAYQVRSICNRALLLDRGKQVLFDSADKAIDTYIGSITESFNQTNPPPSPRELPAEQKPKAAADQLKRGFSVSIHDPILVVNGVRGCNEIKSLCPMDLEFEYQLDGLFDGKLSFVVNIYREDGIYIFGTTTTMRGLPEYDPAVRGRVHFHIPSLPLVSGNYKCRVAVNDGRGLNILAEAVPVCQFSVRDDFKAVGLVDIQHTWTHEKVLSTAEQSTHF